MSYLTALLARFPLRTSLLLLLGLVASILLANRAFEVLKNRQTAEDLAKTHMLERALRAAESQANLLAGLSVVLRQAAYSGFADGVSTEGCKSSFKESVRSLPWLLSLSVISPEGKTVCTSVENWRSAGISDRGYFKQALSEKSLALSDYMVSRRTGTPIVAAAMPRVVDGAVEAVIVAAVDAAWFGRLSGVTEASSKADVVVLDRQGTVVAAPSKMANLLVGKSLAGSEIWAATRGLGGNIETKNLDGRERVGAYVSLEQTGGVLLVTRPLSDIVQDVDQAALSSFAKIGLTSILCLLLIWLGGERLVIQPMEALTAGAASIGSGNLNARVKTTGFAPELQLLGDTFNAMASRIAQQDAELRSANQHLGALAITDGLTGLANRRAFDEKIELETQRAARDQEFRRTPLCGHRLLQVL